MSLRGAAKFFGVLERTVRHWKSGHAEIPPTVCAELATLDTRMTAAANMMCDDWRNRDFPSPFVLFRYNDPVKYFTSPLSEWVPFEAHGIAVHRIRQALERAGATVQIRYGDEYHQEGK